MVEGLKNGKHTCFTGKDEPRDVTTGVSGGGVGAPLPANNFAVAMSSAIFRQNVYYK